MSLSEIKIAVSELPPEELAEFHGWLERFLADKWDEQMETDVAAGRLDHLIAEADREFDAGKCRPI
jgi:hypothetical protein